ncbi:hypothetical protein ACFX13_036872 [Malus domestica]
MRFSATSISAVHHNIITSWRWTPKFSDNLQKICDLRQGVEHVQYRDLMVLSFTYDGNRLFDMESAMRIISRFVENEKSVAVFNVDDFGEAQYLEVQWHRQPYPQKAHAKTTTISIIYLKVKSANV